MIEFKYYTSDKGLFITGGGGNSHHWWPKGCLINGKEPKDTHISSWKFVDGEKSIETYETVRPACYSGYHFELTEEAAAAALSHLPQSLSLAEAGELEWDDVTDEECFVWNSKYAIYSGAYKRVNDYTEESIISVEFTSDCLGDIKFDDADPGPIPKYEVFKTNWKHNGSTSLDLAHIAKYSELDRMLTPSLLIHNQPCSLTSKQTYEIVRHYVLENIDPKCARVTSDYNFCFTVEKLITIEPEVTKREILNSKGKSYARPRFETVTKKSESRKIFSMTNSVDNYKGYVPIQGFKGDNLQELAENIKLYLDELMEYINRPTSQCPHCKGTGNIFETEFDMNKR